MANSVATFDLWQQVYCLSMRSGLVGATKLTGTAADLTKWLAGQLTDFYAGHSEQMGGTWSTVWGPVVFEHDESLQEADNVMYVAANQDRSVFVVAVAGTNFGSDYDKNQEDDAVETTVAWDSAFPSSSAPPGLRPYLSSGAALGVTNLLAMKDGTRTLGEYLASAASTSATLIFAGHSLGGALAPTLALALFSSRGGQLRKSDWSNVHFLATAGPTPGNADLAAYVAQEFPPVDLQDQPYQCWNRVVWNSLDAVPRGWVVELLQGLPELYPHVAPTSSHPWPPPLLRATVEAKLKKSRTGADTGAGPYTQLANRRLDGTPLHDHRGLPILMTDLQSWIGQVQHQHMAAYDVLFKVATPAPTGRSNSGAGDRLNENPWTEQALLDHLQKAVYLELWTIPLYLAAAYSLRVPGTSAANPPTEVVVRDRDNPNRSREQTAFNHIYSIALQEMLHLELAANLFNALFGPRGHALKLTGEWAPRYDRFPGWIDVKLPVQLGAADEAQMRLLAAVETPEPRTDPPPSGPQAQYDSIGQFYKAIEQGVDQLWDALYTPSEGGCRQKRDFSRKSDKSQYGQFSVTISGDSATARGQADRVIQAIVGQGEGSSGPLIPDDLRPEDHDDLEDRVSHYARFRLVQAMLRFGGPLQTYPTRPESDALAAAQQALDRTFTGLLEGLEGNFGDEGSLTMTLMNSMYPLAAQIVAVWAAGGVPAFRCAG